METQANVIGRVLSNVASVPYLYPEIILTLGVLGIILWDLVGPRESRFTGVVVIALGAVCVAAVALALVWRMRQAARQATARTLHAAWTGVPPKHLALRAPSRAGAPRA